MASYNFDKKEEAKAPEEVTPAPTKKRKFRNFVNSSIFSIVASTILFIVALVILILSLTVFNSTKGYAQVNATITSVETYREPYDPTTDKLRVKVTFTVDNKTYNDVEINPTYIGMKEGDKIDVWYCIEDPQQPAKVINTTTKLIPIILCSVFMLITGGYAAYNIVGCVKNKKKKTIA